MRLAIAALLLLTGCQDSEAQKAHKRYLIMIEGGATKADLCAEDKRNATRSLSELDRDEYKGWVDEEKEDCAPK